MKDSSQLSRRTMLRGIGACLSLPLLDAMLPSVIAAPSKFEPLSKSVGPKPRMICCYVPNGVNIAEWVPTNAGVDYELSNTLKVLEPLKGDFSVVTGVGHPASKGGHSGADTWLTGADLAATPGSDYTNSISADQLAAAQHGAETRFPSLQLSDSSGTGSAGHSHTLSFNQSGTPLPAEDSPRRLFERLFVPDSASDRAATLRRYAEQKSILDSILNDAKRLQAKLGQSDKRKLAEYFQSVRETEQRIQRLEDWVDIPKPDVENTNLQLNSQPHNAHDRPMWIDVMLEISYLAFLTDITRVITYQWSREAGGYGGGGENHHELSHHGGDAGMLKKLAVIDRFHLSKLARFMEFLKRTADGESNMLDHTMILFGSGMNSGKGGEHSPKNLPTILAGGKGLGIKQGQHLAFDSENHPPLSNLLRTMVEKMGVPVDSFRDSTAGMPGLS